MCDSCVKLLSLRRLQTDNTKECTLNNMNKWLQGKSIIQQILSAYFVESSEKAERLNRTLLYNSRTVMQDMNHVRRRQRLWAEAINTAIFISNQLFATACNDSMNPSFEIITEKRPNVHLVFRVKSFRT